MIISETRLRQIIREEARQALSEISVFDVLKEPTMKDQSIDTGGKLRYLAARTVGGAVPAGARAVALRQVDPVPSVKQALTAGWNSKLMDWSLTALGASLDFLPVIGVPLSIGVAKVQMVKAAASGDWLGTALAAAACWPVVGDALGILGRAIRDGLGVAAGPAARALAQALGGITTDELISFMRKHTPDIGEAGFAQAGKAFDKFKADLSRSIA
jgi:hypothetical protein